MLGGPNETSFIYRIECLCCDESNHVYVDDSSQSQSSTGDLGDFTGQSDKIMCQGGKPDTGKIHSSYIGMNVCGSAYDNRYVCYGTYAMAMD